MEPVLLGLAAPSLVPTAQAVSRATSILTRPFTDIVRGAIGTPEASESGTSPFDRLRDQAKQLQERLEERLSQVVDQAGIEIKSVIRLSLPDSGTAWNIDVDDPQRELLAAALASDSQIADDFRELAAVQALLSAVAERVSGTEPAPPRRGLPEAATYRAELRIFAEGRRATLQFDGGQ